MIKLIDFLSELKEKEIVDLWIIWKDESVKEVHLPLKVKNIIQLVNCENFVAISTILVGDVWTVEAKEK